VLAAFQKRAYHRDEAQAAGWYQRTRVGDGPNGEVYSFVPRGQVLDYYMVKIIGRVEGWGSLNPNLVNVGPSQYGWSENDNYYWERRILYPWLFVTAPPVVAEPLPTEFPQPAPAPEPPPASLAEEAAMGITPQGGLLADDVVYNLSLLCANVLGPLKAAYPNITIVSAFRQVNNGISQHEKGEAADIQLNNQTPTTLYEVADYIAKNLQFDQLILNYSSAPELSWIHVSFNAQELRRDVRTRDYDDTFYDGLYVSEPLTGEELAQVKRTREEDLAAVDTELKILSARDAALNPTTHVLDTPPVDTLRTTTEDEIQSPYGGGSTPDGGGSTPDEPPYGV
jgi:hypothetical protein